VRPDDRATHWNNLARTGPLATRQAGRIKCYEQDGQRGRQADTTRCTQAHRRAVHEPHMSFGPSPRCDPRKEKTPRTAPAAVAHVPSGRGRKAAPTNAIAARRRHVRRARSFGWVRRPVLWPVRSCRV
jgi:hypothetical protein